MMINFLSQDLWKVKHYIALIGNISIHQIRLFSRSADAYEETAAIPDRHLHFEEHLNWPIIKISGTTITEPVLKVSWANTAWEISEPNKFKT